jgi:Flp pilus assembly CpaF family ATPase
MRIEYVNKITGRSGIKELPPRLNPVRIGQHPDNHLVLDSPYIGAEAGVLDNDVSGGEGWRFWNRNGKPIRVGGHILERRDEYVPITTRRVTVEMGPFVLTVLLDEQETSEGSDKGGVVESLAVSAVGDIHRELLDLHSDDSPNREEWLNDRYIHQLEKEIDDLATRRSDFPDSQVPSDLGNHLSGMAVRAALVSRVIARSGLKIETFHTQEDDTWRRPRTRVPEAEDQLTRLVERLHMGLGLGALHDLTDQMREIQSRFWPLWSHLLRGKGAPAPSLRRYLALKRLKDEIKAFWFGFGPLEELLDDPTINEIMVIDADHIFIEKGGQLEDSGRRFLTDPLTIINKIVARAKRQITEAQPLVDARMADGSRVNAVMPSLALRGPCLTIRRFPKHRITIEDLVDKFGALSKSARDFLKASVINHRNIVVSGGTGSGKTTLLNALTSFIPEKERIVTIEDTAELQVQKPHVVTLQGRQKNSEGGGEITIRDLVRNSLRMRPDRIIVGECRGGEAIDMLQAMNTGHDGSMTTLHANSPAGVVERLEVLVQQNADALLPVEAIHRQIVSAVDLIVQLGSQTIHEQRTVGTGSETRDVEITRKRKVILEIAEVLAIEPEGGIRLNSLFRRYGEAGILRSTGALPSFLPDLIDAGLVDDPVDLIRGDNIP